MHPAPTALLAAAALALAPSAPSPRTPAAPVVEPGELELGPWRARLTSPGGELPFGLELAREDGALRADLVNGPERIPVPEVSFDGATLVLALPHYDSRIEARLGGGRLTGAWRKRSGAERWAELPFEAEPGPGPRFRPPSDGAPDAAGAGASLDGRWAVRFESSADPAVGLFETARGGELAGTFLTTTGDYRYLAGDVRGRELRLSCFDGAHAFLFTARLRDDGTLAGDFWSRDTWHETWTARRDDGASLPDPYEQTAWTGDLAEVVLPDLDGVPRSLADPAFAGRARILQVFGSWCPNCHDEAPFLASLHERYGPRGLSVVGLAFELTGDFERDAQQVRRYAARHGVRFPLLVAGTADKRAAARALPALDAVRSFPTTVFLHGDGRVRAVHSGFAGPATGAAHAELVREFEALVEELLAEPVPERDATWEHLAEVRRFLGPLGERLEFLERGGERVARFADGAVAPVRTSGSGVFAGPEVLRLDREAGVLLDPRSFGRRWSPVGGSRTPSLAPETCADAAALAELARGASAVRAREALVALALLRAERGEPGNPVAAELAGSSVPGVRLAAIWAIGANGERAAAPALLAGLGDANAAVRRECALALGALGLAAGEAREPLERLADDPDPLVRGAAARVLGAAR